MKRLLYIGVVIAAFATPAAAQITLRNGDTGQVQNFLTQVQGALANGQVPGMSAKQQRNLQRNIVLGKVYTCTEQVTGKQPLDNFMNQMNATGQQIQTYCKQGQADQARALAISTYKSKHEDPVAIAAKNCYYQYKNEITPLLDADKAAEQAKFERWADNPEAAEREATNDDICKGKASPLLGVPSRPVSSQPVVPQPTINQPSIAAPAAPTAPTLTPTQPNQGNQ